jgi:molybdopterin-guanine dinucleotide biosynthesis protein A
MTGIVLIGGKSSRFGTDKVVARVREKTLITHVTDVIAPLFDEVILIGHKRAGLESFPLVEDIFPGCGPLGGIYTALSSSKTQQCFVFAADMPNLNRNLIEHMISVADDHDVVIPFWSKGREPLHSIYHKRILPVAAELLEKKTYRIFDLLKTLDILPISEDVIRKYTDPEVTFANINTINDIPKTN